MIADLNRIMDEYHDVQGKLYHLVQHVEPIDAELFHLRCGELIQEKMRILQEMRLSQIHDLLIIA